MPCVEPRLATFSKCSWWTTPRTTPPPLRELFGKRFLSLRQKTNIGFGPACNLAAHMAQSELLFFLNNDTVPQ